MSMAPSSGYGYAEPISILISSAVRSPMRRLYFFLTYAMMAASSASPAMRTLLEVTMPSIAMTATSLVPPPMSTIMLPVGSSTGSPAPIAAAIGSSMIYTSFAPAVRAALLTARRSTSVTPHGMQMMTRTLEKMLLPRTLRMNFLSISLVMP